MDWDKLRVFHAVAEAGSFTHAGDTLNLSQSAVSRQISGLEEALKVPLFHRHARGLILTEQGELLFQTVDDVFAKLSIAERQITENRDIPQGPMTVTTTVAFGSVWLTPRLKEFVRQYPDIELHTVLADNELDLSMRQADVGIRMMPPTQPDLIQRHMATLDYYIYATREYLNERGTPTSLKSLDDHDLIVYGRDSRPPVADLNWLLKAGLPDDAPEREPVLQVNSIYGIFRAVQSGLGIASLPHYMEIEHEDLVRILPETEGPSVEVYFVYPEELRTSRRIAVFRDYLLQKVQESGFRPR